ncbi:uncharacterized protein LOC119584188 [Penaeus monodon]|uniref:uncharacterized protein LOC119584188 n=1 Tax=Penaeus monodon TaxID=6687 RepID=UPI0018A79E1D|nr:uncharacterized protein LOC119584188 [Penaeus monodon]
MPCWPRLAATLPCLLAALAAPAGGRILPLPTLSVPLQVAEAGQQRVGGGERLVHRQEDAGGDEFFSYTYGNKLNYEYTYGDPLYDYEPEDDHAFARPTEGEANDDEDEDDDDVSDGEYEAPDEEYDAPEEEPEAPGVDREVPVPGEEEREESPSVVERFALFWNKAQKELVKVLEVVEELMVRANDLARRGLDYCIDKFDILKAKATEAGQRAVEAVDKLKKLMRQGNKLARNLFTLLGGKVDAWKQQHPEVVIVDVGREGAASDLDSETMPNFFEDPEVQAVLEELVESQVLTLEDALAIKSSNYVLEED